MNTPSHVLCTTTNDKSNKVMGINLLQIIYFSMLKIYEWVVESFSAVVPKVVLLLVRATKEEEENVALLT